MNARNGALTRDDATRRVMKSLARPHASGALTLQLEDGTRPLVVSLPFEKVSEVVERVRSVGGRANVAVAHAKNFNTLVMDLSGMSATTRPVVEITEDLSMGMFIIKIEANPRKSILFRFQDIEAGVPAASQELAYV